MPEEGWYPDPGGSFELRYHDGQDWTEHVFNNGAQAKSALRDDLRDSPPNPWPTNQAEGGHLEDGHPMGPRTIHTSLGDTNPLRIVAIAIITIVVLGLLLGMCG